MEKRNNQGQSAFRPASFMAKDLLAVGFRHRKLIRWVFLFTLLGAVLAVLILGPEYESDMNIFVGKNRVQTAVTPDSSPRSSSSGDTDETTLVLNSEIELLQSDDILEQVVPACGLDVGTIHWWTPYEQSVIALVPGWKEERFANAVTKLQGALEITPVASSSVIDVNYSSSDPGTSNCVLNTLGSLYMAKHIAVERRPRVTNLFAKQAHNYHQRLLDLYTQLANSARTQNAVEPPTQLDLVVKEANDFDSTLKTTQSAIQGTKQRIAEIEKRLASTPPRLPTQETTGENVELMADLKSKLVDLERQRTEMLTKYEPSYRLVKQVETQIKQTKAAIAADEKKPVLTKVTDQNPDYQWLVSELSKARVDLHTLEGQAAETASNLASLRGNAVSLDKRNLVYQDVMQQVQAVQGNYLLYVGKTEQARISDILDKRNVLNVAISERPTMPVVPLLSPTLLIGLSFLLAAFAGLTAAGVAEYLDPTFRTPDEVKEILDMPVCASIPDDSERFETVPVHSNGGQKDQPPTGLHF